ncbi:hypothetical protein ACFL3D_04530 [Candidatus Omnitrophota bacterium]
MSNAHRTIIQIVMYSALILIGVIGITMYVNTQVDAANVNFPAATLEGMVFKTSPARAPVVVIKEEADQICWSDDYFQTYTRVAGSSAGTYGLKVVGNGKDCAAYIDGVDGTRVVHYTLDYGSSWSTTSGGYKCIYTCFSDGGKYIVVGANNNAEGSGDARLYKASINSGGAWYTLPASAGIFYSDTYSGFYSAISRSGKYAVVSCYKKGYAYNTNYLDSGSWVSGPEYDNDGSTALSIAPDDSGWLYTMAALNYQVAYYFSMDFSTPLEWASSAANLPGRGYAFTDGVIGWSDYSTDKHYRDTDDTGVTLVESAEVALWTDDSHSFEVETKQTDATVLVDDVSTGKTAADWYECIFVSRDGRILLIANDGNLYYSEDKGQTWEDRTGTMNTTTSSRMMVQQYNRSW